MKKLLKFFITGILKHKAHQLLRKGKVQVIAITGSIGKTSTKEAIAHLLKKKFDVYASSQGFNTQLGLSLAILEEEESGFSSPKAWLGILKRAFQKKKPSYKKIVAEMGADGPGDIAKLTKIAPPNIGIITNVNPVHLDEGQFENIEAIAKEKGSLIRNMGEKDIAILNADDERVSKMQTQARKRFYGTKEGIEVQAKNVLTTTNGLTFDTVYKGETVRIKSPILGNFQINVLLPAIAVGLELGMSLKECAEGLKDFQLPPSRMNLIAGIKETTIIDSSYNASPSSMTKALELLAEMEAVRKIAAIGTMNEIGELTKEAHLTAGRQAAQVAKVVIAVGPEAATIKEGALAAGMNENDVFTFFESEEAGHFLKDYLQPADLTLVKGSQNRVRMEKVVKIVMKSPEKARTLVCRQEEAWENM